VTTGAGAAVVAVVGAVAVFLLARALPALSRAGASFLTERNWLPDAPGGRYGVAALAFGTVASSAVALAIAVPVGVGTALFVTEVAPARTGRLVGWAVDLLAAVPSVVYGLWGLTVLVPLLGGSLLTAGLVLAVMVVPIVAAVSREVFRTVPATQREAARALGATRWQTTRTAVLPAARGGLGAAGLLGLGRALGETIAVALVLGSAYRIDLDIAHPGGATIAGNVATKFGEAGANGRSALIASGLVLFAITLVVNLGARRLVRR
jgi:phosphate transport system permease protein